MKSVFVLMLTYILSNQTFAQNANTDLLASTGGIGPFKIGMSKAAVEKILGNKIKGPSFNKEYQSYNWDTIPFVYKNMQFYCQFVNNYFGADTAQKLGLYNIWSYAPVLKTKSGIGIGEDKLKIVKTYDKYRLEIVPDYDKKNNPNKSTITLFDNETANVLIFYLEKNIVIGFGSTIFEGD